MPEITSFNSQAEIQAMDDHTNLLQTAIDKSSMQDPLVLFPATFIVKKTLQGHGNLKIVGNGAVFQKVDRGHIFDFLGTTMKQDVEISGITFDSNDVDTGLAMEYVEEVAIKDCNFKNHPWWGISIGIIDSHSSQIVNQNILIQNCHFENTRQTYEHILVFNSRQVQIKDCTLKNGPKAHAIGLWQHDEDISISNCSVEDMNGGIYYSLSTNNMQISDCNFKTVYRGVTGANISDRGEFGFNKVLGLKVSNCKFTQCTGPALVIGGCEGAQVSNCHFEENNAECLTISPNQTTYAYPSTNIVVEGCNFVNNNNSNIGLNGAGLKFESGPCNNVQVIGCKFEDSRTPAKQSCPVALKNFAYSDLAFKDCIMNSYNGHSALTLSQATVSGVTHENCHGQFDNI